MNIRINSANKGLVVQNHAVINAVNKKVIGCTEKDLKAMSSGKMTKLSPEELADMHKKEQKTYSCSRSTIMQWSDIGIIGGMMGVNAIYSIDGVTFTIDQLDACNKIMKKAADMLPPKGSMLEYENYAAMGIASNMVCRYAKENLTEEQAEVVNKSMEEYWDSMVQAEQKMIRSNEKMYIDNTEERYQGKLNQYYNVRCIAERDMYVQLRDMFLKELGSVVGAEWIAHIDDTLARMDNGETISGMTHSATNKDLASKIKSLFTDVDLYDDEALSRAYKKYWNLMKPLYDAVVIRNPYSGRDSIAERLRWDMNAAVSKISDAKAVIDNVGRKVNCSV